MRSRRRRRPGLGRERPGATNLRFVEPLVAVRNAGDDEKDGHSDSHAAGPDRALEARVSDRLSSTDRATDNVYSLRTTVLVSPEFVAQRFALDGPRAISWKSGDMDEEFCSAVGWRNEPEATIGVPGPQDASELHAWGLPFAGVVRPHATSSLSPTPLTCRRLIYVVRLLRLTIGMFRARVRVVRSVTNLKGWTIIRTKLCRRQEQEHDCGGNPNEQEHREIQAVAMLAKNKPCHEQRHSQKDEQRAAPNARAT